MFSVLKMSQISTTVYSQVLIQRWVLLIYGPMLSSMCHLLHHGHLFPEMIVSWLPWILDLKIMSSRHNLGTGQLLVVVIQCSLEQSPI